MARVAPEKKEEVIQMAMFLVHMQAKISTYHNFDRFVYAMAAIMLGGKLIDQLDSTKSIVMTFRTALRKIKKRGGIDSEDKINFLVSNVGAAESMMLVNLGFDLSL